MKKNIIDYYNSPEDEKRGRWLVSFSDLLSLILAFFVLLYSMSAVKKEEWEKISNSVSKNLAYNNRTTQTSNEVEKLEKKQIYNMPYLKKIIDNKIQQSENFTASYEGKNIAIALNNSICQNIENIDETCKATLSLVVDIINDLGNEVEIITNSADFEYGINASQLLLGALKSLGFSQNIFTSSIVSKSDLKNNSELGIKILVMPYEQQ
jgi:flagellar motor protein MotB